MPRANRPAPSSRPTEAAAAAAYWTDLDLEDPVYQGYEHTIATLNWGGKRDYATWFSAEPSALLGILLIPMGPFADYLAIDPERMRASIAEAAPGGFGVQFGDYLLMYQALAGPDDARAAWDEAQTLPDDSIDDGSSRGLTCWPGSPPTSRADSSRLPSPAIRWTGVPAAGSGWGLRLRE